MSVTNLFNLIGTNDVQIKKAIVHKGTIALYQEYLALVGTEFIRLEIPV